MTCYLYVLRCGDGSLYTGVTNDLARRLAEHQAGRGGRYTRAHLPVTPVAVWQFPSRAAAMRAELHFKALRRRRKLAYVTERRGFEGVPFAAAALANLTD
jgi:putative endonuclease